MAKGLLVAGFCPFLSGTGLADIVKKVVGIAFAENVVVLHVLPLPGKLANLAIDDG